MHVCILAHMSACLHLVYFPLLNVLRKHATDLCSTFGLSHLTDFIDHPEGIPRNVENRSLVFALALLQQAWKTCNKHCRKTCNKHCRNVSKYTLHIVHSFVKKLIHNDKYIIIISKFQRNKMRLYTVSRCNVYRGNLS